MWGEGAVKRLVLFDAAISEDRPSMKLGGIGTLYIYHCILYAKITGLATPQG